MNESDNSHSLPVISSAVCIVAAFVSNNSVPSDELPSLIEAVHKALLPLQSATAENEPLAKEPKPAISMKRSVTPEWIICLEDGKKFKSLKRHLRSAFNLTPDEYRLKWGLPKDYPMVAPAYAASRSELARKIGLGQKRASAERASPPARSKAAAQTRHRAKKAA